jgi:bifunctional UDP-N-acetylglucosamine pyrophosphorylase/glucosamine-1-phosphate N-acetyltransferase
LVKEIKNPLAFGVIVPQKNCVKDIAEKSKKPPSNLVNAGGYFIPKTILKEKIEKSLRGEYEITDYVRKLAKKTKVYFFKAKDWVPLSFAWGLLDINEHLLKNIKTKIIGKVEKNCQIKPPIIIEKGTIIKSGAYIQGPVYIGKNCQIGPNCYIRPFTSIEDNCVIGQAVEIKNSIISQGSRICHLSYAGDSVIGENCNLSAGTILANLRFDGKNVHSIVKGKLVDTQRKKFGAVLGNNVKTGINVSIMPGVLIGSNSVIGPHSLVKENVKDNQIFYTKHQKVAKKWKF